MDKINLKKKAGELLRFEYCVDFPDDITVIARALIDFDLNAAASEAYNKYKIDTITGFISFLDEHNYIKLLDIKEDYLGSDNILSKEFAIHEAVQVEENRKRKIGNKIIDIELIVSGLKTLDDVKKAKQEIMEVEQEKFDFQEFEEEAQEAINVVKYAIYLIECVARKYV